MRDTAGKAEIVRDSNISRFRQQESEKIRPNTLQTYEISKNSKEEDVHLRSVSNVSAVLAATTGANGLVGVGSMIAGSGK